MSVPLRPSLPRRLAKQALRQGVDAGLVGSRLDTHLVICGFPRSGTTLLQLLLETCVDDVCSFIGEVEARWACEHANRRERWLVTKRPDDIFEIGRLRTWYEEHPGRLGVVVPMRDPRDVLTSTHAGYPPSRGYYCEPVRWRRTFERICDLETDPDVVTIRYEDLVSRPQAVQDHLDERLGLDRVARFEDYESLATPRSGDLKDIDLGALGGIRPLDDRAVARWNRPEHRQRLADVLAEVPELPAAVRRWGYSDDDVWVDEVLAR